MAGTSEGGRKAAETRKSHLANQGKQQQSGQGRGSNLTDADRIKGGQNPQSGSQQD